MDMSKLRLYTIAVVSEDKKEGSDVIRWYSPELLSLEQGDPNKNTEDKTSALPDIDGVTQSFKGKRESEGFAKWMPNGCDNKVTSPDVIAGESVKIYRYANSKEFFWTTVFREPQLRRKEHVVHAYGNIASGREAWDMSSSYGQMWSTKDKKILFWTSQSDGEAFKYQFLIDTKNYNYSISDNVGNALGLESNSTRVYIRNSAGSFIEVDQSIIRMTCGDNAYIHANALHVTGSIHSGKNMFAKAFVLGGASSNNRDPVKPQHVMFARTMRMSGFSDPRIPSEYQPTDGYLLMGPNSIAGFGQGSSLGFEARSEFRFYGPFTMKATNNFQMDLGNNVNVKVGSGSIVELEGDVTVIVKGKTKINVSGSLEMTGNITINGRSY